MEKRSLTTRISIATHEKYERLCKLGCVDITKSYQLAVIYVLEEDWDDFATEFPNARSAHGEINVHPTVSSAHSDRISKIANEYITKKDLIAAMLRWCVRDDHRSEFNDYLIENTEAPEVVPKSSIVASDKDFGTDKYMEMDRDELESEIMDDIDSLGGAEH